MGKAVNRAEKIGELRPRGSSPLSQRQMKQNGEKAVERGGEGEKCRNR